MTTPQPKQQRRPRRLLRGAAETVAVVAVEMGMLIIASVLGAAAFVLACRLAGLAVGSP